MSSAETDRLDRAERERQLEANLAADRRGRGRLRDLADEPPPDKLRRDTPNTYPGDRA
jgi:hypothetical protein